MVFPVGDVGAVQVRGVDGGILIAATDEERQLYRDKVLMGTHPEVAVQEIAELIRVRTEAILG